jgi:hypothetical protein
VVERLTIRRINHWQCLAALADHRLVVNKVQLHGVILRVKKPAMVAMCGLYVT